MATENSVAWHAREGVGKVADFQGIAGFLCLLQILNFASMEDTPRCLRNLGYCNEETLQNFDEIVKIGAYSRNYTSVIAWLSKELMTFYNLESCINATESGADASSFFIEMRTFLREMECPHRCLNKPEWKAFNKEEWLLLADYLIAELMCARIFHVNHKKAAKETEIKMPETNIAAALRESLQAMSVSKPPPDLTCAQLFTRMFSRIIDFSTRNPVVFEAPLVSGVITDRQWTDIHKMGEVLYEDYKLRREMMVLRLDVTKDAFLWGGYGEVYKEFANCGEISPKIHPCEMTSKHPEEIQEAYSTKRAMLSVEPLVRISDLLSYAKSDTVIEKASCESVRVNTRSAINEVVIGPVPDRGGRVEDQRPPPPEVPSWQKNEPFKTGARPKNAGCPVPRMSAAASNSSRGRNWHDQHTREQIGQSFPPEGSHYKQGKCNEQPRPNHQQQGGPNGGYHNQPRFRGRPTYHPSNAGMSSRGDWRGGFVAPQQPEPLAPHQNFSGVYTRPPFVTEFGISYFGSGMGGYGGSGGDFIQHGNFVPYSEDARRARGGQRGRGRFRGPGGDSRKSAGRRQ